MERPIVCILGRPNVGKSTLFNVLTQSKISITEDTPGVTRDRIYAKATWLNHEFTLIDTGGLDPSSDEVFMPEIIAQAEVAVENAEVILFLVDGKDGLTEVDREVADYIRRFGKKVLLVINKMDSKLARDHLYDFYELGLGEPFIILSLIHI